MRNEFKYNRSKDARKYLKLKLEVIHKPTKLPSPCRHDIDVLWNSIQQPDTTVFPTESVPETETATVRRGKSHFLTDVQYQSKREVPRGVRNSKVRRQDKFRRDGSRHQTYSNEVLFQIESGTCVLRTFGKQEYQVLP